MLKVVLALQSWRLVRFADISSQKNIGEEKAFSFNCMSLTNGLSTKYPIIAVRL